MSAERIAELEAALAAAKAEIVARDVAEQHRIDVADRMRLQVKRDLREIRCPHCGRSPPEPKPKAQREANARYQKAWRDRQKAKAKAERDRREAPMLAAAMERVRKMQTEAEDGPI